MQKMGPTSASVGQCGWDKPSTPSFVIDVYSLSAQCPLLFCSGHYKASKLTQRHLFVSFQKSMVEKVMTSQQKCYSSQVWILKNSLKYWSKFTWLLTPNTCLTLNSLCFLNSLHATDNDCCVFHFLFLDNRGQSCAHEELQKHQIK